MFKDIDGGVCAPLGFQASGIHCGIRKNKSKKDLSLIVSDVMCHCASTYTQNKVKGAPIYVTQQHLKNLEAKAIICNSGNANTCNPNGKEIADKICQLCGQALGIDSNDIVVASTGVIGQPLSIEPFENHMEQLVQSLSRQGSSDACEGIMTTDTVKKEYAVELKIGDKEMAVDLTSVTNATTLAGEINDALNTGGIDASYEAVVDGDNVKIQIKDGADVDAATVSFEGAGVKISGELEDNRGAYVERYNDILTQIDQLAKDAGYKGVNLLGGDDQSLTVVFNEDRSSSLTIQGVDGSAKGLGLEAVTTWKTNEAIDATLDKVSAATNKLRSMSSEFGNNYAVVQTREEFTENLINVLEEGSDKLTFADMNEESANMLALQTRQQLAINSLSLASQAAQSVLSLF